MIWIILFIVALIDGVFQNWWIHKYGTANHAINTAYRTAIGVILVAAFHLHGLQLIFFAAGAFCGYKLLFDAEENLLRHRPLMEVGTTPFLDRLQSRIGIPWEASTAWEAIAASGFIFAYYNVDLMGL